MNTWILTFVFIFIINLFLKCVIPTMKYETLHFKLFMNQYIQDVIVLH